MNTSFAQGVKHNQTKTPKYKSIKLETHELCSLHDKTSLVIIRDFKMSQFAKNCMSDSDTIVTQLSY